MRRCTGFTLLEMLVAIGLTAALVLAAYQIFRQVTLAHERARPDRQRDLTAAVFLDRFERELVGTTLVKKPEGTERPLFPWVFFAEDRVFGSNDSDALRFITQTPARAPGAPRPGLRVVSYAVAPAESAFSEDGEERLDLFRAERILPAALRKSVDLDEALAVLEDVHRFELRFRDERTSEWHAAWDSTDLAMLDSLPRSVEVTITLVERDLLGGRAPGEEHTRVVQLPMRPFSVEPEAQRTQDSCPDGPTIDECLELYQDALDAKSEEEQRRVYDAADATPLGCWLEPSPSPQLAILHETFQQVLGIPAEEACE